MVMFIIQIGAVGEPEDISEIWKMWLTLSMSDIGDL
jgi:hypothetical protein